MDFGDEFCTRSFLVLLGIQDTCLMRCDYFHMMMEVWPKMFGPLLFRKMRIHLDGMIKSKTLAQQGHLEFSAYGLLAALA